MLGRTERGMPNGPGQAHPKARPAFSKWKRSVVDGETVEVEVEDEEVADVDEGEEDAGESRGERSAGWARSKQAQTQTVCKHVPVKRCTSRYINVADVLLQ